MKLTSYMIVYLLGLIVAFIISSVLLDVGHAEESKSLVQEESVLETQVRAIAGKLRCPVCQGESVYDSHAEVAVEMKELIREKITAGETPPQILSYFQERYGNYILMAPPAEGIHWVIWVFPVFFALVGVLLIYQQISSTQQETHSPIADQTASTVDDANERVQDIKELRL